MADKEKKSFVEGLMKKVKPDKDGKTDKAVTGNAADPFDIPEPFSKSESDDAAKTETHAEKYEPLDPAKAIAKLDIPEPFGKSDPATADGPEGKGGSVKKGGSAKEDAAVKEEKRKIAKNVKKGKKAGKEKGQFLRKLKIAAIILVVWLVLAGILRLAIYMGSFSHTHLTDEGLTHAIRYQNSLVIHGIDVSEYQDDINWKRVKSSEADFVFIRAGYRSAETGELNEDADFKENIKKANKADIMTGVYFFSQAVTPEEAVEEADYLLELVKPYDIDMPLVIDFEIVDGGRLQKAIEAGDLPYASLYHDIVLAFCQRVEKAGYESAVYANYDMLTNYMDSTILDDEATIWAAQYDGTCYVKGNYMFWQCAEDASVDGIDGSVDHDIWYIEPGKVYATKAAGKKNQVSIGDCEITFDADSYTLHNHRAKPKVTVTYNGKKLRKGKDYEVSFVCNTTTGTGYAIVRGKGKYKDWTSKPFEIVKKKAKADSGSDKDSGSDTATDSGTGSDTDAGSDAGEGSDSN